ncbi:cell wall-binding repeat-containing protein [Rathayibacter rathayi]|nr:hypothetical protein [Rathayibacter rathayi NCPPB 2980 = VKM Ac-1601]
MSQADTSYTWNSNRSTARSSASGPPHKASGPAGNTPATRILLPLAPAPARTPPAAAPGRASSRPIAAHRPSRISAGFADALAVGPVAARLGAPLYLSEPTCLPRTTRVKMQSHNLDQVLLLGSPLTLSAQVRSLTAC